jgi:hypothetical protein
MTVRDFDAMLAERAGVHPTFRIGGQEFTLRAKLPYKRWNKLMAAMRADDADEQQATVDFFRSVLIKDDRERFVALLDKEDDDDDENAVVDLSQMDALTDWIMEHFTGKRRNSSESSTPGANGTGLAPNVVSLQPRDTAS